MKQTDRINQILQNETYRQYVAANRKKEEDRVFCHHDMSHFLDVARIAMLLNEAEQLKQSREMIYAAALLHDTGRWVQYETGEDHALVSARLAPPILQACGFAEDEIACISSAIKTHREAAVKEQKNLNGLLYRADKLSRPCFACDLEPACNWKGDKKNLELIL